MKDEDKALELIRATQAANVRLQELGISPKTNRLMYCREKNVPKIACDHCSIKEYAAEIAALREGLAQLRDDIIENANDTVWVGLGETACERITTLLGDDWGKDGKCEARKP